MDISRYATVADVGVKPTIPSEADFVIAYATSEGKYKFISSNTVSMVNVYSSSLRDWSDTFGNERMCQKYNTMFEARVLLVNTAISH